MYIMTFVDLHKYIILFAKLQVNAFRKFFRSAFYIYYVHVSKQKGLIFTCYVQ